MKRLCLLALFVVSSLCTPQAQAIPLTWNAQATYGDGGTLTGSFVYDADLGSYTNIALVTTAGTDLAGYTYATFASGHPLTFTALQTAGAPVGSHFIQLEFASALTNAGGTIGVPPGVHNFEATCSVAQTCIPTYPARFISSGSVSTTVSGVPEPATAALVPLALLALAACRRYGRSCG
jgi:hypothetical protein